jgi:hypothetical protein
MQLFIRAVVTGFGLSIGAALYKRLARQLGLDEPDDKARQQPQPIPGQPQTAEPVTES